jgi:predicted phage terminase large subunit-like protein
LNDPDKSAIVVIMQRLHDQDVSGHILKEELEYQHLCLPMEYEGNRVKTGLNFVDPRTEEGELLNPKRFSDKSIIRLKNSLGSDKYAGQFQQRPTPKGGGKIKIDWFKRYDIPPTFNEFGKLTISVDCANKDKELNDPSGCHLYWTDWTMHYLIDRWMEKLTYPKLRRKVKAYAEKHKDFLTEILIEDKGNGIALIQDLQENTDLPVIAIDPGQMSKEMRLETESPKIEAGNVAIPRKAIWLYDFEDLLSKFPKAAHDEDADCLSQYLKRQRGGESVWDDSMFSGSESVMVANA